jgi:hypothetical protein
VYRLTGRHLTSKREMHHRDFGPVSSNSILLKDKEAL